MNRLIIILTVLVFLNSCSFNENSRIWKNKENKLDTEKKIKKVFVEEKKIVSEFNQNLKLDLSKIKTTNKIIYNQNNFGSQQYVGQLDKITNYKFSKLTDVNQLNLKPVFLKDGIIFFDKKGSILRYDVNGKVIWKKNFYSKAERKLKPILNFFLDNQNLIVVDNVAKYYSINIDTGNLNWFKYNTYPFNSNIKKFKNKIFVVDYKNTLRCYKVLDGSECWNLQTEDSFTKSNVKYSLILLDENVIFSNSLGDVTAVNLETGLITWQLPTQNSSILNKTYNFKVSTIVSDGNSLFFSNNKNEFYSIDSKTGTINWINEINSIVRPILIENLIFTISNEGYLYVIDKNKGNIIRVSDIFKFYKSKKRKNITPVGFVIGNTNLYLTNSDGKLIVVSLINGNTIKVQKVSGGLVSEPFIFNDNLFVVRNGSIVQYN